MLARAVRLTLAEAASEWMSGHIREELPEGFGEAKVIKPAAGYSSCPDHTLKRDILKLLPESEKLGITLLDSCAMLPDASICGLIFIHPEASYPEIRRVSRETVDEYARRRAMSAPDKALPRASALGTSRQGTSPELLKAFYQKDIPNMRPRYLHFDSLFTSLTCFRLPDFLKNRCYAGGNPQNAFRRLSVTMRLKAYQPELLLA